VSRIALFNQKNISAFLYVKVTATVLRNVANH
jgi:hypothetical protein